MRVLRIILFITLTVSVSFSVYGQKKDSLKNNLLLAKQELVESQDLLKEKEHSPNKAMIYEMILPGLGHIYNKRAWQIPITYAAFATTIYFIIDNTKKYQKYRDAYADFSIYNRYLNMAPQYPIPPEEPQNQSFRKVLNADFQTYSTTQRQSLLDAFKRNKDRFKKYRDLSYILLGTAYLLNIMWVVVDAHFFNYDISNDLSMHIKPQIYINPNLTQTLAINLSFHF